MLELELTKVKNLGVGQDWEKFKSFIFYRLSFKCL